MRQGWEAEAENWAVFARTPGYDHVHQDINLPVLLSLLPDAGTATLDLACGEGRLSRLLRTRGHRVVGVDYAPTMIRLAATHPDAVPAVRGDATALPFPDQAFDLVVAYMCLHDIDAMPQAVAEIARVLRPGGRLCAAIPHPVNTAGSFEQRDPTAPFIIRGSYLDTAPTNLTATRGDTHLTFHSEHRPLESYTRALEQAPLLIEALREPRFPDDQAASNPPARRWQRIPMFLHIRALKPAGS
jgi:SAM-dependent methyltransferase